MTPHELDFERALAIATEAHAGQTRMDGTTPYITHPMAVALSLAMAGHPELAVPALLHDVLEDNPAWTVDRLLDEGIAAPFVMVVEALTRREGETYGAYIERLATEPRSVIRVKLADLRHNLLSLPEGHALAKRFERAMARLQAAL